MRKTLAPLTLFILLFAIGAQAEELPLYEVTNYNICKDVNLKYIYYSFHCSPTLGAFGVGDKYKSQQDAITTFLKRTVMEDARREFAGTNVVILKDYKQIQPLLKSGKAGINDIVFCTVGVLFNVFNSSAHGDIIPYTLYLKCHTLGNIQLDEAGTVVGLAQANRFASSVEENLNMGFVGWGTGRMADIAKKYRCREVETKVQKALDLK
ncbi:hypothetical protein [Pseudodesulfovibrio methanolicus]|uniref:Uncharacterized protein n=1 Tax=Pseudodesulfovibrio methanolicus TaxID=3126690 RepID=A0ABZ2IU67_9BACT